MAAHPRSFGHCFNPISVFWCFDGDGAPAGTVVEVHNTYGDRHAYLVHPDAQGRARTDKQLYVSPFHGVDGSYELAVPEPGERLTRRGHPALRRRRGRSARACRASGCRGRARRAVALRTAPAGIRGALLIRIHGVWLWARRPARPAPTHPRAARSVMTIESSARTGRDLARARRGPDRDPRRRLVRRGPAPLHRRRPPAARDRAPRCHPTVAARSWAWVGRP